MTDGGFDALDTSKRPPCGGAKVDLGPPGIHSASKPKNDKGVWGQIQSCFSISGGRIEIINDNYEFYYFAVFEKILSRFLRVFSMEARSHPTKFRHNASYWRESYYNGILLYTDKLFQTLREI